MDWFGSVRGKKRGIKVDAKVRKFRLQGSVCMVWGHSYVTFQHLDVEIQDESLYQQNYCYSEE